MKRCAVCLVQTERVLCPGCQLLIKAPENPCQICAKPLNQIDGFTELKAVPVGEFQPTKRFITVNKESCEASVHPEDESRHASSLICGECRSDPPAFAQTICAAIYEPPVSLWVQQLKFGDRLDRASIMAEAMLEPLSSIDTNIPIIPIPLHPKRLQYRGYNQAYEVAKIITKQQHRALLADVLIRTKYTAMQAELHEKQRADNVRAAFKVIKPIGAETVLLLDDVMTTGQTLHSAAKCLLLQAAVKKVMVVVFARSGG